MERRPCPSISRRKAGRLHPLAVRSSGQPAGMKNETKRSQSARSLFPENCEIGLLANPQDQS
jgi:hypothetical protein